MVMAAVQFTSLGLLCRWCEILCRDALGMLRMPQACEHPAQYFIVMLYDRLRRRLQRFQHWRSCWRQSGAAAAVALPSPSQVSNACCSLGADAWLRVHGGLYEYQQQPHGCSTGAAACR